MPNLSGGIHSPRSLPNKYSQAEQKPRRKARYKRLFGFIWRHHLHYYVLLLITLVVILQATVLVINAIRSSQPILGLHFHRRNVASLSGTQINSLVQDAIVQAEKNPLIVKAGSFESKLTARQLGARYNTNFLVATIYNRGHIGSLWSQLIAQDKALLGRGDIRLGFPNINDSITSDFLAKAGQVAKKAPTNAWLGMADNKLVINKDRPGYELNIEAATAAIKNYDESLDGPVLNLPLRTIKAEVTVKKLQQLKPQISQMVGHDLKVQAGAKILTIKSSELLNVIAVEAIHDPRHPTRITPSIVIDQVDADKLASKIVLALDQPAQTKIVDKTKVVTAGQDGQVVDGLQTKLALSAQLLLRQQGAIEDSKPLNLAVHNTTAPSLPKVADPQVYGGKLAAYDNDKPKVILAFDAAPNATYTPAILNILKKYNVHAVFFAVGRNVVNYPDVTKRIVSENHLLGASSYAFRDLTSFSASDVTSELNQTQSAITKATGTAATLFWPPYSSSNEQINSLVAQAHLQPLGWTIDGLDWGNLPSRLIISHVLSSAKPGSIVLLHTLYPNTIEALPKIITGLQQKGYSL